MNSIERSEALRTIAFCVAEELGHPWAYVEPRAEESNWSEFISNLETGMKIYFSLHASKGYEVLDRVEVSGSLNIGKNGQFVSVYEGGQRLTAGSISVARDRGVVAIAKAIRSRFLPEYTRVYGLAVMKIAADSAYDYQVTANLQRLAKASDTVIPADKDNYRSEARSSFHLSMGEVYGTAQASNDTAQLELRCLTIPQAEYILRYLKLKRTNAKGESNGIA